MSKMAMPDNLIKIAEYGLIHYLIMGLLSVWAATVRHLTNIKNGGEGGWVSWLIEVCISGFVGVLTGLLCQHFELDILITFVIVAVSAHTGTNTLILLKDAIIKSLKQMVNSQ